MNESWNKIQRCVEEIRKKTDLVPETVVVLGSGLGNYGEKIQIECSISYSELPGFPVSTVPGHEGRFLFGYVEKVPVVLMQGRVHFYEGYPMEDVILPTRIMGLLGAKQIIFTNAAGGINLKYKAGDLMMLTDHISLFVPNPLIGPNLNELGVRFPDMSSVYDKEIQNVIRTKAKEVDVDLKEGVYVQCQGPSYESPAEIRLLRTLGADAVGMSTVCEAIAARHMGMKIAGISCITNMAAGILEQPLNHEEVQEAADKVQDTFSRLITEVIKALSK